MSLYLYDNALVEKLKSWTVKTDIHVYGPNETRRLYEVLADETNDSNIKLPMLVLSRDGGYTILNSNKRPLTYDGKTLSATLSKSMQLNAIPISISYQIDVYARFLEEADAFARDLVFNIINHSTLHVTVPYNGAEWVHQANIFLDNSVEDNSNITERLSIGEFSRMTLKVVVDDAYLWDSRERNNVQIEVSNET